MFTDCYYQLPNLPNLDEFFINDGLTATYHYPPPEVDGIHTRRVVRADTKFADSTFVNDLRQKLTAEVTTVLLKNDPHTCYDWHSDDNKAGFRKCRKSAINILLNQVPDSVTLFRKPSEHRMTYNISDCPYVLHKPMLFNVLVEHCIINNSDQPRYLLSIGLGDTLFGDAIDFFKTYTFNGSTLY